MRDNLTRALISAVYPILYAARRFPAGQARKQLAAPLEAVPCRAKAALSACGPVLDEAGALLGDSLAVELSALTRAALVRIQVPQPDF